MSIIYGKGIMFSLTTLVLIVLFLSFIFFLLPYKMDLGINVFRSFIALGCAFIMYLFSMSLVEIVIEENNIQLKTFKQYRTILFDTIQLINIYYFTTWGIALIRLRVEGKSCLYFLWTPKFETERYELFVRFVNSIKERAQGNFIMNFRT